MCYSVVMVLCVYLDSSFPSLQQGETNMVIDNIHSIIAAAGVKFNEDQLDHLFKLILEVIVK